MKHTKKITAVLLALSLLFAVTSCEKKPGETPSEETSSSK